MNERLLQFIWQFQYYNKGELCCQDGSKLQILFPGNYNSNQGPDFMEARIRIGKTSWAGSIEIHILTSDWEKHKHSEDENYRNVVLHVVWEDDESFARQDIPVLELRTRVSKLLLSRYEELMQSMAFIPCEKSIASIPGIIWKSWKDRLVAERLTRKSGIIEASLQQNNFHWEETFWWLLARNFGMKVNADSFEAIARSVPLKILAKHKNELNQLEAILFGQAGLLGHKNKEAHPRLLFREYKFLKRKYGLRPVQLPIHFLRMRPGNFPTIRLAQLAGLIHHAAHLFSGIKEAQNIKELINIFDVKAGSYWDTHYRFGQASRDTEKAIGNLMIGNITINTIAPMLFTYGKYHKEYVFKEKAIHWLEQTAPENNSIIRGFDELDISSKHAFDTQALHELKTCYCDRKACLECSIGNAILKLS